MNAGIYPGVSREICSTEHQILPSIGPSWQSVGTSDTSHHGIVLEADDSSYFSLRAETPPLMINSPPLLRTSLLLARRQLHFPGEHSKRCRLQHPNHHCQQGRRRGPHWRPEAPSHLGERLGYHPIRLNFCPIQVDCVSLLAGHPQTQMPNHLTGNHPLQRLRRRPEFHHGVRAAPVGIAYSYATYVPHQNHPNVVQHTWVYRHLVSWWSCTAPTPTYQRACVFLSGLPALQERHLRPQELIHAHAGHSASWPLMLPSSWRPEPLCTSPSGASGGP